jgi:hypothetical protein
MPVFVFENWGNTWELSEYSRKGAKPQRKNAKENLVLTLRSFFAALRLCVKLLLSYRLDRGLRGLLGQGSDDVLTG